MKQSDYNSMMRYPWERKETKPAVVHDEFSYRFLAFMALGFYVFDSDSLARGDYCKINWGIYEQRSDDKR